MRNVFKLTQRQTQEKTAETSEGEKAEEANEN